MKNDSFFGMLFLLIVGVIFFLGVGPQGCSRQVQSWYSSAYGSDWLVVQFNLNGAPINVWELRNKSIGNERQSDGIFFIDNEGNVVHLSGQYVYIQISNWDKAREKYPLLFPKK